MKKKLDEAIRLAGGSHDKPSLMTLLSRVQGHSLVKFFFFHDLGAVTIVGDLQLTFEYLLPCSSQMTY